MTPERSADEVAQLKAWYLAELQELQDELSQLRCLHHQDRTLLLELVETVKLVTGVSVDGMLLH